MTKRPRKKRKGNEVYYGPALLQCCKHDKDCLRVALHVLAEVYRAGRALWPVELEDGGRLVTVEIGEMNVTRPPRGENVFILFL